MSYIFLNKHFHKLTLQKVFLSIKITQSELNAAKNQIYSEFYFPDLF